MMVPLSDFYQPGEKLQKTGKSYLPSWMNHFDTSIPDMVNILILVLIYTGERWGMEYPTATLSHGRNVVSSVL
ncbi:MAG: hypothetical protein IPL08_10395 [Saprospiraceae bacterium]|nr:hypothetical protein [Saprospiraceae bacterium]